MFAKKFVRVEALAIARAIELAREAGFSDLYLATSRLASEKGIALERANAGEELYDVQGEFIRFESLTPDRLGLEGEIEGFLGSIFDEQYRGEMFLVRHYMFEFNSPAIHKLALWVNVMYGKVHEGDDWTLLVESVFAVDERGIQAHDPIIYRDYRGDTETRYLEARQEVR